MDTDKPNDVEPNGMDILRHATTPMTDGQSAAFVREHDGIGQENACRDDGEAMLAALSLETGTSVEMLRPLAGISDPANIHMFTREAALRAFSDPNARLAADALKGLQELAAGQLVSDD
ncbi:MAG: hypothetical protein ABJD97_02350, partial [Betaproteobacteria bacterium]